MKAEVAKREIESLDYYLQNHTNDYSEESHTAMMMAIQALGQEPKSEWQQDHEILKAYSDGANDVLDHVRAEIEAYQSDAFYHDNVMMNKRMVLDIIDKYKAEGSEE